MLHVVVRVHMASRGELLRNLRGMHVHVHILIGLLPHHGLAVVRVHVGAADGVIVGHCLQLGTHSDGLLCLRVTVVRECTLILHGRVACCIVYFNLKRDRRG